MQQENSDGHENDTSELLSMQQEGQIAILSLNNPKKRNSLSEAMLSALLGAIENLENDDEISVIILRAEGPVFCAGHDLKELTAHRDDDDFGRSFYETTMELCSEVMQAIMSCPKPVIAAVQGTATAAGCQLVASCDLAVADEKAKFCTPGVNIGLFCSTPMVALSRNVPRKRAMEMLLLGDMISAEEAASYGLINKVVACDDVMKEAMALAEKITAKPQTIVAIGKEAFYTQAEMPVSKAYDYAIQVMVENMMMPEANEGISAFLEKRKPKWQN